MPLSSSLSARLRRHLPLLVSALALPLCSVIIHPTLAMGTNDDWSYTRTALLFAQTGHFVYVGWSSAMLGWQVVLAALFIKLFGFSFDVVRYTGLLVAMATAALFHSICIRSGIRRQNATLATLALIFSPLFLPLAFSFMTDVPALFCIVLCLYLCIRALQSGSRNKALAWIVLAAFTNVIGGTCRQSAWLGVLVIVPSTMWLLRRSGRSLVLPVLLVYGASIVSISYALHWFAHQPHAIVEPVFPGSIHLYNLDKLRLNIFNSVIEICVLLAPVLLIYVAALARLRPRWFAAIILLALGTAACCLAALHHGAQLPWLAPTLPNYLSADGVDNGTPILGNRPVILNDGARLALTLASLAALLCFFAFLVTNRGQSERATAEAPKPPANSVTGGQLVVLLAPFTFAYISLIITRITFHPMFDRYLLPLIMVAILCFVRYTDGHLKPGMSFALLIPILLYAAYGVVATHDAFAMYRAESAAVHEALSAGIPGTEIDGGFEYNGWTQVGISGYIADPLNYQPSPTCRTENSHLFPAITARYVLSYDPGICGGLASFPSVTYKEWLGPTPVSIYIVSTNASPTQTHQ